MGTTLPETAPNSASDTVTDICLFATGAPIIIPARGIYPEIEVYFKPKRWAEMTFISPSRMIVGCATIEQAAHEVMIMCTFSAIQSAPQRIQNHFPVQFIPHQITDAPLIAQEFSSIAHCEGFEGEIDAQIEFVRDCFARSRQYVAIRPIFLLERLLIGGWRIQYA